jgi:hypothetical protein
MVTNMNPGQYTKIFRTDPVQYTLGNGFSVKLDNLANARQFEVPVVKKQTFILTGTMDTTGAGGTTALGADAAKLWDQIKQSDEAEVIRASGAMLRLLRQSEIGSKAVDPADVVNTVNAAYEARMEIIHRPLDTRACRPQDFDVPLEHYLDGGTLEWNTPAAVPTGFGPVNADWKVRVEFECLDARKRELKSRRRIFEQVVSQQEFEYNCGGSLRHAIVGSKLTTTGYTSLAGFSTIYSRSLDVPPNYVVNGLREMYRFGADAIGANDNFLATTPTAINLVFPHRYQRTGRMLDLRTLHIDLLQVAPAGGRLLLDVVTDRTPNLAALEMGFPSAGELAQAIDAYGWIVGEGANYPVRGSNKILAKRLPIRLRPGKKVA